MLPVYYHQLNPTRPDCLEIGTNFYKVISNNIANEQITVAPINSPPRAYQQFSYVDLLKKEAKSFCFPCSGSGDGDLFLSLGSTRVRNYPTCKYCGGGIKEYS